MDRWLWFAQAAGLVGLAAAAAWGLLRARSGQRALARLVVDVGRAAQPGGLRAALAAHLGDDVVVAYRVGDGRWADAVGAPVAIPPGDGRRTTVLDPAGAQAVLVHRLGLLDDAGLVDEMGSVMRLGLENERLQALALTQLADLRDSRVRLVETGDDERRRLERDLHDGAQQQLVGVLLALRLLRSRSSDDAADLAAAELELQAAIDELRGLAHGLFPAVLRDEGLRAALGALSETRQLRLDEVTEDRLPLTIETTAYLVVARAVSAGPTSIRAVVTDDRLAVTSVVRAEPGDVDVLDSLADRVHALGGELTLTAAASSTTIHLSLPVTKTWPEPPDLRHQPHVRGSLDREASTTPRVPG